MKHRVKLRTFMIFFDLIVWTAIQSKLCTKTREVLGMEIHPRRTRVEGGQRGRTSQYLVK